MGERERTEKMNEESTPLKSAWGKWRRFHRHLNVWTSSQGKIHRHPQQEKEIHRKAWYDLPEEVQVFEHLGLTV